MSLYQHFRPEEKVFIDQVLDWKMAVEDSYAPKLTDFLDPREQHILSAVLGKGIGWELFGGGPGNERKRALIFPEYFVPEPEDFQIALLGFAVPKFSSLTHRDVLGAIMGSGVKRSKIGDIIVAADRVQFFAAKELASYFTFHLDKVGNTGVNVAEIPLEKAMPPRETWKESSVVSSSLRLDAVLSASVNLARQKVQQMIRQGLVKVNWKQTEDCDYPLREGDVISVRGFGRIKILGSAKTKKEKWRLLIGKQK
ncbi:MAG: RNA-binding protein [Caldibacillus debilis]|uniref:RNA-binding protein n=1 Tax=Caldibacillus debilis TaxID=301148 RepID=A0A3E0K5R7_9BACI|nr:RNA-binding protein [Caldibacillus debilis]REJ29437.1 MAG: RNA-binding protein [Caldibacillus debilis]